MQFKVTAERDSKGTLLTYATYAVNGTTGTRNLAHCPEQLSRDLTGCYCTRDAVGGLLNEDGSPVSFYFDAPYLNTVPVRASFENLPLPDPLSPSCTKDEAERWCRLTAYTIGRRVLMVKALREEQIPEFKVSHVLEI